MEVRLGNVPWRQDKLIGLDALTRCEINCPYGVVCDCQSLVVSAMIEPRKLYRRAPRINGESRDLFENVTSGDPLVVAAGREIKVPCPDAASVVDDESRGAADRMPRDMYDVMVTEHMDDSLVVVVLLGNVLGEKCANVTQDEVGISFGVR